MECQRCSKRKLTSEFPSNPLSDACDHHHLLVCLRCAIKTVESTYTCPVKGCDIMLDPDACVGYWECRAKLKQLVFDYSSREKAIESNQRVDSMGNISIVLTTLLGETHSVRTTPDCTVAQLKEAVVQHWRGHGSADKVKLLHRGEDLQDRQQLGACGVGDGSRVQVLFVLQELTPDLTEVRVSMSWGWPGGRDHTNYLDAACFTFGQQARTGEPVFLHSIDFRTQRAQGTHEIGSAIRAVYEGFVQHDGEAAKDFATKTSTSSFTVWPQRLDGLTAPLGRLRDLVQQLQQQPPQPPPPPPSRGRRGHHQQHQQQQQLPQFKVTHLFFVIFTFRDTDISVFRSPRLQVYDVSRSGEALCSTNLHPQAKGLVVCLLSKVGRNWQVTDVGQPLYEGSVREYQPVVRQCLGILQQQQLH